MSSYVYGVYEHVPDRTARRCPACGGVLFTRAWAVDCFGTGNHPATRMEVVAESGLANTTGLIVGFGQPRSVVTPAGREPLS